MFFLMLQCLELFLELTARHYYVIVRVELLDLFSATFSP